jgi:Glycosyltransferase family 87
MLTLALGVVLVLLAAGCLTALGRPRGAAAFLLGVYVLGAAEMVALSAALSLVDRYTKAWLLASILLVAVVAVGLAAWRRPPRPRTSLGPGWRLVRSDAVLATLAAAVLAGLAYELALALFTPENDGDGLQYHLTRAALWRQQHAIGYVAGAEDLRINAFPPGAEILTAFTMTLSGSVRYVGLVQYTAMLACAVAAYGIGRRIGLEPAPSAYGALLFLTLPIVALQASSSFNDIVVASWAAAAAFGILGRSRLDVALCGLAAALLVATKVTGLFALPVLVALALVVRPKRIAALAAVAAGCVLGSGWYLVNAIETGDLLGTFPASERGSKDLPSILARTMRQLIDTIGLPGAVGRDRWLFVLVAVVVLAAGLVAARHGRWSTRSALVTAALTVSPLLLIPVERILVRGYQKWWYALDRPDLGGIDPGRDLSRAGVMFTWYGPIGLLLTIAAAVVVVRRLRERRASLAALVLVTAPLPWIVALSVAVTYFEWNGRFTMGAFALAAATWGLLLDARSIAWAATVVATLTLALTLVHYDEKPSGLRLLEPTAARSVWTTPRWVLQTTGAGHGDLIRYADEHVPDGARVAIWPSPTPSGGASGTPPPFPFLGRHPAITRTLVYASSPAGAAAEHAGWAILPIGFARRCSPGWRTAFTAADAWAILRRDPTASCG